MSYDPGAGGSKTHWTFSIKLLPKPLTAPVFVDDGATPPVPTVRAESSKNVHVSLQAPNAPTADATAKFYIQLDVTDSKGNPLGMSRTNTVGASVINAAFEMDVPLTGNWSKEGKSGAKVTATLVQGRRHGFTCTGRELSGDDQHTRKSHDRKSGSGRSADQSG